MGSISLRIGFHEIDGFIKIYDEIRYLVLFGSWWYDEIYDRIKYLISEKCSNTDSTNHNFAIIRIDLYNSLPIEKILTFHNVKLLVNNNNNHYYYNMFLGKGSYEGKSNTLFLNECLYIINAIF